MSCLHAYFKIVWRRQGVGVNSGLNSIRTMVNSDLNSIRTLANSDLIFIWTLANSNLIFIWTLANSDLVFMRSELVSGEGPNWPRSESSDIRLVPVRVWESVARGKSVRNNPNASVVWSSVPVRVWMSHESMALWKSVRNHPNSSVTWSSRAVHWPNTGLKLENLWVIPRHAVRARKIFRRLFDPYGRHRARSWKLSLHKFLTRASYEFGTAEGS